MQTVTAKSQVSENKSTCGSAQMPLTPQWTPESQKQGQIDIQELPSDVAEIVTCWPNLPEHIKAAIKALVQSAAKQGAAE